MIERSGSRVNLLLAMACFTTVLCGCGAAGQDLSTSTSNQVVSVTAISVSTDDEKQNNLKATALRELIRELSLPNDLRAVALIFVLPDCPIANSYAAEYSRLNTEFSSRGIPLVVVYVDPELSTAQMHEHARQYLLNCPVLLDPRQVWVDRAGATKTPEAAVFGLDGKLLYRGRIDDRYVGVGKSRTAATSHDLRNAFESILAGQPVAQRITEAIGCHIPDRHEG